MSEFLRKYNTATHVYVPMIKRGVVDFAVGADWTPAAGDVKVSKDGGAAANIGTLPAAIAMGNTATWDFTISATELQCAKLTVTVGDSATKAVEDQQFDILTYGNASAELKPDLSDSVRLGLTALPNAAAEAAGGLYTRGSGAGQINQPANGSVDTNVVSAAGTAWGSGAITAASIATGAITSAKFAANALDAVWSTTTRTLSTGAIVAGTFAANALDAVWSTATRVLTAGTNIVLAKGTGLTGLNDLSSAQVQTACAAATASLSTQASVDTANTNILTRAVPGDAMALTSGERNSTADALLDRASAVDTYTPRGVLRVILAALGGKLAGAATTTVTARAADDSKTRITATVDANGNRTAVTLDAS